MRCIAVKRDSLRCTRQGSATLVIGGRLYEVCGMHYKAFYEAIATGSAHAGSRILHGVNTTIPPEKDL